VCRGVKSLTIDGQPLEGNAVPMALLRSGARVVAVLG